MSDSETEESILKKFQDPVKKRQRKEKRNKQEEERKAKIVNAGKRWAKDEFNSAPSAEELSTWKKLLLDTVPSMEHLEEMKLESESMTVESIKYVPPLRTDGLYSIMNFVSAMDHCTNWLNSRLTETGWKMNATNYDPVAVSHSTTELLAATLECYRMAIKQMILIVKG